jgi:phosphatidylglycerol:prolipoprotein diacylglycerol transferase
MTYGVWILLGLAAAGLVRRMQPPEPAAIRGHRSELLLAAAVGAVLGAFLADLPAGWFGWDGGHETHRLGGRTVLGGLIGGWLAVELAKHQLGIRQPTGDGFAAPLAAALACGRLGCLSAGCCGPSWVTLTEVGFHAAMVPVLLLLARQGLLAGRRLAAYLTVYAGLRIALEGWRGYPPVALGLTWYQWLALGLMALAGGAWIARSRPQRVAS